MTTEPENEDAPIIHHKISEGRISMRPDISEEEAIRTIVQEGTCADFVDVANVVQKRFGLKVGSAKVEEVVRAIKHDTPGLPASRIKHADIGLTADFHRDSSPALKAEAGAEHPSAASVPNQNDVLRFVESMGGFEAAKEAIVALEGTLRKLIK